VLRDVAADVLTFVKDNDQVEMIRTVVAESRTNPELGPTFYRFGKAPLLERFVAYLRQATSLGSLTCRTPELAARQYLGMIQECLLWPRVMDADEALTIDEETVISSAVTVFLAAYGPRPPANPDGPTGA
jgi:TetR/AcrR family transcriptional regulator of autoinduction and epiphytic fitness